jgi:hypothetical protein
LWKQLIPKISKLNEIHGHNLSVTPTGPKLIKKNTSRGMLELVNAHSTGYLGIIYNIYNLVRLLVTIIGKDNEGTLNLMGDGC